MAKERRKALDVTRAENFADWYQAVISGADMAETSGVRGCMVIKPWGFKIWERIQGFLDHEIKATGHENCYFPIFIPLELIQKEAAHVEGFAKEMAVVTHHRLEMKDGKLVPAGPLETPLVVRPTSETMIGEAFARWIQSWRDLPVKLNQWCNVVRWEMRPRLFLRTSEFLWQEGHTAHATAAEAVQETRTMLDVYRRVVAEFMAIPVISGVKSANERFPGAEETHTIEAMMQDGRALQAGTSHYLGDNFARAANISYQDRAGHTQFVHTTSWGVSTRLIGGLIMVHGDDDGLRLPPRLAPWQIVILPILRDETQHSAVYEACERLCNQITMLEFAGEKVRCFVDPRDDNAATKRWNWIRKGVPLICEIGPRDIAAQQVTVYDRRRIDNKAESLRIEAFVASISDKLAEIQQEMLAVATANLIKKTRTDIKSFTEMKIFFEQEQGFVRGGWNEEAESEAQLQELGLTIRCLPYDQPNQFGTCLLTGKAARCEAIFARAY